ncbi:MAG: choice-of-anchor J domain-containing protein [Chitinophagales bacterium]|nr:choice-of-anchor J domain-containing protein [Chitinophagales bacterium]
MRNKILLSFIALLFSFSAKSQQPVCGFDQWKAEHLAFVNAAESVIQNHLQNSEGSLRNLDTIYTIPVVVHVIHNGGIENISDAQVQSQIDVLNEDYRKIPFSNGDGNGVDTYIQFCLAKLDPDGDCTEGIVRIQSLLTNHDSYERAQLSQLSSWDPSRYLNIYVVKTIGGSVLGYASFPGGPVDQDGVVMVHNAFGTIGTVTAPYNLGRTCSHEAGHWFGLYHTFNGGCGIDLCNDGDLVCDTPPVVNPNFGCPNVNTCSNDFPDVYDQIENYMDYTNDACKSMLTEGQSDRMHATLNSMRFDIWQPANISATGCDSNYASPACIVVADFISNGQQVCLGNTVSFTNKTLNDPTSFEWIFAGGDPSTSTVLNPQVTYSSVGSFDVTLITTGANGSDTLTLVNYIMVSPPQPGQAIPYDETFEQAIFPPYGIVIDNSDNGITWERDTVATQFEGVASAKINNLINTNYGQADALILPAYDLTSFAGSPYLTFRWAYAKSDVNYSDELIVLLSTDCGLNFTQVFYKSGSSLTTGPTQVTPYIPDSTTIWKQAKINLNNYVSFSRVIIKIVNVTDGGNNLYIDSLHIGSPSLTIIEELNVGSPKVYPNPFTDEIVVELPAAAAKTLQLSLYDELGRKIDTKTILTSGSERFIHWKPALNSPSGLLIFEIKSDEFFCTEKLVRQK